jgi:hypothetical protein
VRTIHATCDHGVAHLKYHKKTDKNYSGSPDVTGDGSTTDPHRFMFEDQLPVSQYYMAVYLWHLYRDKGGYIQVGPYLFEVQHDRLIDEGGKHEENGSKKYTILDADTDKPKKGNKRGKK